MKLIILVFVLSLNSCGMFPASMNNTENQSVEKEDLALSLVDTLQSVELRNGIYENNRFLLFEIRNSERHKLNLMKNGSLIHSINFPVSDLEVKNFTVSQIAEKDNGFILLVNWGGGNDFYMNTFHFVFHNETFYLDKITMETYDQSLDKKVTRVKKITRMIDLKDFSILEFLDN